jgi:hypothetical protein
MAADFGPFSGAYYGPFKVGALRGNARVLYDTGVNWAAVPFPKSAITDIYIEQVQVYSPSEITAMFIFAPLGAVVEFMEQHAMLWFVKALVCKDGQPQLIDLPIRGNWDVSGPSTHIKEPVTRRVLRFTLDVFRADFPSVPRTEGVPRLNASQTYAPPVTSAAQAVISGRSPSPCGTSGSGKLPFGSHDPNNAPTQTGNGNTGGNGGNGDSGNGRGNFGTDLLDTGPLSDNRIRAAIVLALLAGAYLLWKS